MNCLRTAAIFGGLLTMALGFGGASGPATRKAPAAPASTSPTSQPATYIVKKGTLAMDVQLEGVFQPAEPFEVRFKLKSYGGPLTVAKAAAPFAVVRKGDVLVECESVQMRRALVGAENEAKAARRRSRRRRPIPIWARRPMRWLCGSRKMR